MLLVLQVLSLDLGLVECHNQKLVLSLARLHLVLHEPLLLQHVPNLVLQHVDIIVVLFFFFLQSRHFVFKPL